MRWFKTGKRIELARIEEQLEKEKRKTMNPGVMMTSCEDAMTQQAEKIKKRLKFIAPLRNERTETTSDRADYLGLENIQSWTGKLLPCTISESSEDDNFACGTANVFYSGDVLFGKLRPYLAKALHADKDGVCSTELLVLKPEPNIHPRFLLYSMLSPDFVGQVDASTFGAKMPRANWEFIGSMKLSTPTYETQRLIADYLDRETGCIDALVAEKEKMLALLEEKRAALISRVVTRGLDPNAHLKPSGLDWLGEIPEHWEVTRFKYVCDLNPTIDLSRLAEDDKVTFLPMDRIKKGYYIENTELFSKYNSSYNPFLEGDIVIAKVTPCFENGNIAIAENLQNRVGFGSSEIFVIRPVAAQQRFIFYYLQSAYFKQQGEASMAGAGGLKRVSPEFVRDHFIGLPSADEQVTIANFLDQQQSRMQMAAQTISETIILLKERRSALITAAVTGRIPVEEMTAQAGI